MWNGQKAGGLSLRVKRDERVGVWWLDGVDVSVMAWCQTLCHCQCQPHQPIPQWSATVQCVSKPLCCCHFNQCVGAAVLSHFCPLSNSLSHWSLSFHCCLHHELCVCIGLVGVCCVMSSDGVRGVDDAVCLAVHSQKRQHSTRPCLHVMVCTNASCCVMCGG